MMMLKIMFVKKSIYMCLIFFLLIIKGNISSLVKQPSVKLLESLEDVYTQQIFYILVTREPQRQNRNCFTQKQTTHVSSHPAEHELMRQEGCLRTAHIITTYSRTSTYIYSKYLALVATSWAGKQS